jgi:hypothetical protein
LAHGSGHGKVTDYWGEPFNPPEWRRGLSGLEDVQPQADEGGQNGDRSTRRAIENRREKEAPTWNPRSFSPASEIRRPGPCLCNRRDSIRRFLCISGIFCLTLIADPKRIGGHAAVLLKLTTKTRNHETLEERTIKTL